MLLNLWTTALFDSRATNSLHALQQTLGTTGTPTLLESALLAPSTLSLLQQWGPLWLERLQDELTHSSLNSLSSFALHPLPEHWDNAAPVVALEPLSAYVAALTRSSRQAEFALWACPTSLYGAALWKRLPVERFLCLSPQLWQKLREQGIDKERLFLLPPPSQSPPSPSPLLVLELSGLPQKQWNTLKVTLATLSQEFKLAILHLDPLPPPWESMLSSIPHSLLTSLQSAQRALSEAKAVLTSSDLYWSSLAPEKSLLWPAQTAAQREDSLFLQRQHHIVQLPTLSSALDVLKQEEKQPVESPTSPVTLEQLQQWALEPAKPLEHWPTSTSVPVESSAPSGMPSPEEWKQRTAQFLLEIKRAKEQQEEAAEHLKHWVSRKALAERAGVVELEKEAERQCKRLEGLQKQEQQKLESLEQEFEEWRTKKPQRSPEIVATTQKLSMHEQDFARLEVEEELKALKQRLSFHRDQLDTLKDED